jgi:hypothetical protein
MISYDGPAARRLKGPPATSTEQTAEQHPPRASPHPKSVSHTPRRPRSCCTSFAGLVFSAMRHTMPQPSVLLLPPRSVISVDVTSLASGPRFDRVLIACSSSSCSPPGHAQLATHLIKEHFRFRRCFVCVEQFIQNLLRHQMRAGDGARSRLLLLIAVLFHPSASCFVSRMCANALLLLDRAADVELEAEQTAATARDASTLREVSRGSGWACCHLLSAYVFLGGQ